MRRFFLVLYVAPRQNPSPNRNDLEDHVLNYWKNVGRRELAKSSLGRMVVQSSILNRRASGMPGKVSK
jgi:hypothetical protein